MIERRRFLRAYYIYSITIIIHGYSFDDYMCIVNKISCIGLSHISDEYFRQCVNNYLDMINQSIENEIVGNNDELNINEIINNFLYDEPILSLEEEQLLIMKVIKNLKICDLINHFNKVINGQNICLYHEIPERLRTETKTIQNLL